MEVPDCILADNASEYGSEFTPDEEDILKGLLQVPTGCETTDNPIVNSELQIRDAKEHREGLLCLRAPTSTTNQRLQSQLLYPTQAPTNVESDSSRRERESSASIEAPFDPSRDEPDIRSPLQRFRTKPQKPLSVTDLISPSWCELQYWYVLTKHGKKRRTPAMRQGSKVHKTLENQVHVSVPVEIQTREDSWGLRLWNIIQGLRTLRETGMTREFEVWGFLDGQVVNGVIDELTYQCPDRELEATAEQPPGTSSKKGLGTVAPDQATITEYLSPRGTLESAEGSFANALHSSRSDSDGIHSRSRIYISDVKTRGARSLPRGASFRPTMIQLSIYHRLLAELAEGNFDSNVLFDRFNLDRELPFTDSFIAQIGNLNQSDQPDSLDESIPSTPGDFVVSSQESLDVLLGHNSLAALWTYMMEEIKTTFPLGAKTLGPVLKAEYRDSSSGDVMGSKVILYEHDTLQRYLSEKMEWWRGERSAQGVPIEEAFKCGSCEFAEGCEWRINKIDDHVKQVRSRSTV